MLLVGWRHVPSRGREGIVGKRDQNKRFQAFRAWPKRKPYDYATSKAVDDGGQSLCLTTWHGQPGYRLRRLGKGKPGYRPGINLMSF